MKQLFILKTLLFFFVSGFTQSKTFSLKQCIDTAIANNLELRQSDLQLQVAGISWRQAKANLLPGINGSASHGINQGRSIDPFSNSFVDQRINFASYGLNAGLPLFNGLAFQHTIRQQALAYDASRMDLQQVKDNLALNIILAYLQVLSNTDLLVQSRSQVEVSSKQVQRLEIMNKDGAISPSQLSDLQGELAGNELTVIGNQTALEAAKLALFQLMNIEYDENFQIEPLIADALPLEYGATPREIYEKAVEELGLVKAANLRRQSAAKGVQVAKGLLYPVLSLNGNINTNYSSAATQHILLNTSEQVTENYVMLNGIKTPVISPKTSFREDKIRYNKQIGNNLYTAVSLDLRIPLFNSLVSRNRIKLAAIDLKNTEYIAESTKIQLRQSIERAYVNMTAAHNRYKTTLTQVAAFAASFRAAEVRFNAGVGTVVDYIIAKSNADRANSNLIIAGYDYLLRAKVLDYYQGKPLW